MIDLRFPTALQLMLSLALARAEGVERLTSSHLAEGVHSNPTMVRRLLAPLLQAGLVTSSKGREGGVSLGCDAAAITLKDIYGAVMGDRKLWSARTDIPHRCTVSCNMEPFFDGLTARVDDAVLESLDAMTLADSLAELRRLEAIRTA
ncbi:MAG: Rrf2 family transcriptional regulator [Holophaga sp.]|nr:Rrf2 family transcriptional regulator [Holophaga sp.]